MSSISVSSSSFSTMTTFREWFSSWLKTWFSLKIKLEKYRKFNICERSLIDFIAYIFASLALLKSLYQRYFKQPEFDWLIETNSLLIGNFILICKLIGCWINNLMLMSINFYLVTNNVIHRFYKHNDYGHTEAEIS